MKKIFTFSLVAMMLVACGGQKSPQDGGHGIGIDSATVAQIDAEETDSIAMKAKEASELTYANMDGIYDSLDENMSSVSRISLNADGTATWCMIGSLNYTEYTYRIEGNTICMKAKGVDSEEECYEYDSDTRTLKNEQGAVYYRQVAE
jgi:hypothetical protein